MLKLALAALVVGLAMPAWSQQTAPDPDRANRPGGTTQIAPSPGPATSPAFPSPTLPQAAVENRDKAQAAKAAHKGHESTKAKKKSGTRAHEPQSATRNKTSSLSATSKAPAQ